MMSRDLHNSDSDDSLSQLSDASPVGNAPHSNVRTLFISNLPLDTSRREIYLLFRNQPGYTDCILRQKEGSPPCAFVTFSTHEHALEAMNQMQGIQFDPKDTESRIRIEFAKHDTRNSLSSRTSNLNISNTSRSTGKHSPSSIHSSNSSTNQESSQKPSQKQSRKRTIPTDNRSKRVRARGVDQHTQSNANVKPHMNPTVFPFPNPSIPFPPFIAPHPYMTPNGVMHFDTQIPGYYFPPFSYPHQPQYPHVPNIYPSSISNTPNPSNHSLNNAPLTEMDEMDSSPPQKTKRRKEGSIGAEELHAMIKVQATDYSQVDQILLLVSNLIGYVESRVDDLLITIVFENESTAKNACEILRNFQSSDELGNSKVILLTEDL